MTEESDTTANQTSIIRVLADCDFMQIAVDETPKPTETLKEIGGLYNIMKVHLAALIKKEIKDNKLNIKDVVSISREISKLNEMLFVFSLKLGEIDKKDKPKDTETLIELASHLPDRDKNLISERLREQIKLEIEDEQDGSKT